MKKNLYMSEFPIIVALAIESQNLWSKFCHFYTTDEISDPIAKDINSFKDLSPVSEDMLNLVKYSRNMVSLTKRIFWKKHYDQMSPLFYAIPEFFTNLDKHS
jgi:hypothetical protein